PLKLSTHYELRYMCGSASRSSDVERCFSPCNLHHVLPHLARMPSFINKYASLFPAHRAALFDSELHWLRKCDFGDHSVSNVCASWGSTPGEHQNLRFNAAFRSARCVSC